MIGSVPYGGLTVKFELPNWDEFISRIIDPNDLIEIEGKASIEHEPHVTIFYGFKPEVTIEDVKSLVLPLKDIEVVFTEINFFRNLRFDVIKFAATSPFLNQMNEVMKTLPHVESDFPSYIPHMTIAFVKTGNGEKYQKVIKPLILKPISYCFKQPNQDPIVFG